MLKLLLHLIATNLLVTANQYERRSTQDIII